MTINSRPLTYLYDENEIEALSPSHLMIGRRLQSRVDTSNGDNIPNLTYNEFHKRLKYLDVVMDNYWRRFHTDYLSELREQHISSSKNIGKSVIVNGDVVLIKDDEMLPRSKWKKGVITKLIQGKDGNIRGAAVKCIKNDKHVEYQRPVQRLIPFELIPELKNDVAETSKPPKNDELKNSVGGTEPKSNKKPYSETHSMERPRRIAAIIGEANRRLQNQM